MSLNTDLNKFAPFKKLVVITGDRYPNGDAGAIRTHYICKAVKKLGIEPIVLGYGKGSSRIENYDGINFYSFSSNGNSLIMRIIGRLFFPIKILRALKHIQGRFDIMFISGSVLLFKKLIRQAKTKGFNLIYDCVEWYSPSEFNSGKRDIRYIQNNYINTKVINTNVKIIAISTYLENYFALKKIKTVRIPAIVDVLSSNFDISYSESNKIKIIYAGMPGRKDRLLELIDAIGKLTKADAERIQFNIYGLTKNQFLKMQLIEEDRINSDVVVFHGRKDRQEVLDAIVNSDFSYLLRDSNERYAKAGFPTKAAEGLTVGNIMFTNMSSDLSYYLKDGFNCIEIEDSTVEGCYNSLNRLLSLSESQIIDMKRNARKTAEEYFDWRLYSKEISTLFSEK